MNLNLNPNFDIFIPDDVTLEHALKRSTHIGIAAHSDDLEIMASSGIIECYQSPNKWFLGVLVTNSAKSPCNSPESSLAKIIKTRANEQKKAAMIGEYSGIIILNYSSEQAKNLEKSIENNLIKILDHTSACNIFTHSPADRHLTHVATSVSVINAIRNSPKATSLKNVYGCEVWGSLDWLSTDDKIELDTSNKPYISEALLKVFDTQIGGGKRYDMATLGRRIANATFSESHSKDKYAELTYAIDLMPLIKNPHLKISEYVLDKVVNFSNALIKNVKLYEKGAE